MNVWSVVSGVGFAMSAVDEMTVTESGGGQRAAAVVEDLSRAKRRVWKNVVVISVAFLFNFNAFQGLSRLQSTLNRVEGDAV